MYNVYMCMYNMSHMVHAHAHIHMACICICCMYMCHARAYVLCTCQKWRAKSLSRHPPPFPFHTGELLTATSDLHVLRQKTVLQVPSTALGRRP